MSRFQPAKLDRITAFSSPSHWTKRQFNFCLAVSLSEVKNPHIEKCSLTSCPKIESAYVQPCFSLAYLGWSSFPSSFNTDPFRTSTHTSSNNLTVMLRTSLCLNDTRPLFLQDNACATLNDDPHTQVDGIRSRGQLLTDSDCIPEFLFW